MVSDAALWPGSWRRVTVSLPRAREDEAIGQLFLWGAEGASVRPGGPGRLVLEAWFADEDRAAKGADKLASLGGARPLSGGPEVVMDPGWLAASQRPRRPLRVGPFVVLDAAPGRRLKRAGSIPLLIPRGRAFGTGEHPTTRMCLGLLARHVAPQDDVLDLGTGSGILAIAAIRSGARRVLAVDNDPAIIEVVRGNIRLNGAAGRIAVRIGTWEVLPARRFDLILANIHRTALIAGAAALARCVGPGGRVILSGFSPEDAALVRAAWARRGFALAGRRRSGEWAALALRLPESGGGGVSDGWKKNRERRGRRCAR